MGPKSTLRLMRTLGPFLASLAQFSWSLLSNALGGGRIASLSPPTLSHSRTLLCSRSPPKPPLFPSLESLYSSSTLRREATPPLAPLHQLCHTHEPFFVLIHRQSHLYFLHQNHSIHLLLCVERPHHHWHPFTHRLQHQVPTAVSHEPTHRVMTQYLNLWGLFSHNQPLPSL